MRLIFGLTIIALVCIVKAPVSIVGHLHAVAVDELTPLLSTLAAVLVGDLDVVDLRQDVRQVAH